MKRKRLLLTLKDGDAISLSIQGNGELLGVIRIDDRSESRRIRLVFDFVPSIAILRERAKIKGPKK